MKSVVRKKVLLPGLLVVGVVLLYLGACFAVTDTSNVKKLKVVGLRCESLVDPLGVDSVPPRLSWRLESDGQNVFQSAWHILVASSKEKLEKDDGDLWNSKTVQSGESINIEYQGKTLESGRRCFWKVRVWDSDGNMSEWSKIAFWEMGLLHESDWQGIWINDGKKNPDHDADFYKEDPAPLFRHEFHWDKKVKEARLYIAGLGYYEARLNGHKVGDHVLDPPWTKPGKRVFYSTFDVTKQLQPEGKTNCVGVTLGNGWYNPLPMKMWGRFNLRSFLDVGRPRFIAQLNVLFEDGTTASVFSSPDWKVTEGPIRRNNIYLGEVYDARQEKSGWDRSGFNDFSWKSAVKATEPVGKIQALSMPPIRVRDTFHAVSVKEPVPGVFVYDMGENFGGWARLTLNAPVGTKVVLRYGELVDKDGTLNPMTSVAGQIKRTVKNTEGKEESMAGAGAPNIAWQADTWIARGVKNETYCPQFTFHAFRYLEVTGLDKPLPLESVQAIRLSSDVEFCGEFSCSNEEFNRIQKMCRRTFLANIFSVQSDCPHRERFGYGGDILATCEAFMMNFDMATFYAKTVGDWSDSVLENGVLTDTAPFVGIQYCGVAWAIAHPELMTQINRYYGNVRLIKDQYETARRWMLLVQKKYPNYIVNEGLSDHESLEQQKSEILVTPIYYQAARMMERLAGRLGRTSEAKEYAKLAREIASAYGKSIIDSKTGIVGKGTQASQVFALYTDAVYPGFLTKDRRKKILITLLDVIQNRDKKHLATGILGTKYMLDQLSREGEIECAYRMANQPDFPGWRWMLQNGATTLWEHWAKNENVFSHNHPMFGSISQWFFQHLGGIAPDVAANGFDRIQIAPKIVDDLNWVKTSYQSVRGEIVSNWTCDRKNKTLTFNLVIPANTKAKIVLPIAETDQVVVSVLNNNKGQRELSPAQTGKTFVSIRTPAGREYSLGSGHYRFMVSQQDITKKDVSVSDDKLDKQKNK